MSSLNSCGRLSTAGSGAAKGSIIKSGRRLGFNETLEARHLITQCQSPLLEPTQHQIIRFRRKLRTIDQGIQVRMLNTHVDQPPEIRMKVFVHETLAFGVAKITIDPAHNALD